MKNKKNLTFQKNYKKNSALYYILQDNQTFYAHACMSLYVSSYLSSESNATLKIFIRPVQTTTKRRNITWKETINIENLLPKIISFSITSLCTSYL